MASKEDGESSGFLPIKRKKKRFLLLLLFSLLSGFLFVGSIYIKREPIIVLIEQDSGHNMGFGFENLISKMVRENVRISILKSYCMILCMT